MGSEVANAVFLSPGLRRLKSRVRAGLQLLSQGDPRCVVAGRDRERLQLTQLLGEGGLLQLGPQLPSQVRRLWALQLAAQVGRPERGESRLFLGAVSPSAWTRFFPVFHLGPHHGHLLLEVVLLLHKLFVLLQEVVDGVLKLLLANIVMVKGFFQLLLQVLVHFAVLVDHHNQALRLHLQSAHFVLELLDGDILVFNRLLLSLSVLPLLLEDELQLLYSLVLSL